MTESKTIAQLPLEIRQLINCALRDGHSFQEINRVLEDKGQPALAESDLTIWREGGYRKWALEQERIQALRGRSSKALKLSSDLRRLKQPDLATVNELVLASLINDLLEEIDMAQIKALLQEKPEHFFKLASAVSAQISDKMQRQKASLDLQKHRNAVAEKKKNSEAKGQNPASAKTLSQDILRQMEEEAKLL